ncbi:unnamed protein product, partial [Rotaria magnacalcarata]
MINYNGRLNSNSARLVPGVFFGIDVLDSIVTFFTIAFVLIYYLRHTYLHEFTTSCVNISQYWVSVRHIQEFLNAGEFNQQKMIAIENEFNSENIINSRYSKFSSSFQLRDVTFSARTGDLIIVIGSIASGKSSLLMTLLGEMKMIGGAIKLNRNARFRYVPQAHEIRVVSHNVSIDKESPNAILQIL